MGKSHLKTAALVTCILTATSAQAASVSAVSTIRITTTQDTWLQISEIVALDMNGIDVALAPGASTSSSGVGYNGLEINAVNGIAPGFCPSLVNCTPADPGPNAGEGLFHSSSTIGAFFEVSLAAPTEISALSIFGRTDCCSSRDIYDVQLIAVDGSIAFSATNQSADNVLHEAVIFSPVPLPAAAWLFGSGLIGLAGLARRKQSKISTPA